MDLWKETDGPLDQNSSLSHDSTRRAVKKGTRVTGI